VQGLLGWVKMILRKMHMGLGLWPSWTVRGLLGWVKRGLKRMQAGLGLWHICEMQMGFG